MIFIFAEIDKYQLITKEAKREVEIRVKNKIDIEILNKNIGNLRKRFPTYNFYITLYDNFKIDNLNLNKLDKFKNHINQNLKLLVKVKLIDERKTKNNKYMYTLTCELPGQRKYIKCKTFNNTPLMVKLDSYYIINGILTIGDEKYIKKNEKALGKNKDYYLNIRTIEEYDFKEKEIIELQKVSRAELHAHTSFSKNDAFITIKGIEEAFDSNKLHSMAITDHGAVFAFIPYVNALKNKYKDTEKKLILGSEFYSVDYKKYQIELNIQLNKLEEEKENIKNNNEYEKEIDNLQLFVTGLREKRKEYKKIMNRKTVSTEDKEIATDNYNLTTQDIDETLAKIKELKTFCKDFEERIIQIDKEIEYVKNQFDTVHDCDRDHLTVLLKTPDTTINYRGEEITINLGLVKLYQLISESYINYFSSPVDKEKKKFGKRPTLPYHLIFNPEIRKNFIITSACAFGKHMKLAIEDKWEEFREWIHNLDAVEIQPSWNNSYMVAHEDYPNITKIEDVYKLHRAIYQVCKEENVPCIITSDGHINNKEDRIFRAKFKEG